MILALAAALTIGAASAQVVTTTTHFEGERITGFSASHAFDIVLVKSNQPKAIMEVDARLQQHVKITRDAAGVVTVGMKDIQGRMSRDMHRLLNNDDVKRKVTIFLPEVNTIRMSGATELHTSDVFPGKDVDILLSGASEMDGLRLEAARVKLQCSGASEAALRLTATTDLVGLISGASEVDIYAEGLTNSKLGLSGASELEIKGNGARGDWGVSGSSELDAVEFEAGELKVSASGASSARVNATVGMAIKASGAASVRYKALPTTRVENSTSGGASSRAIMN